MSADTTGEKLLHLLPTLMITLIGVFLTVVTYQVTTDKIKMNQERASLAVLNDVITAEYDNDLILDRAEVTVPATINPSNNITAYRARQNNRPVAIGLMPIITKAYNGNLSLVIGIRYDGLLTGVRILRHNETAGFGDTAHQDRSDWILGFNGYSVNDTKKPDWAIKKDGGQFDQLSGATITSRSIITVVYNTLTFYSENRDLFYAK